MSEQLDKEMEELEELEEVTANAKTISATSPSSVKLKQEKEDMQKAKTSGATNTLKTKGDAKSVKTQGMEETELEGEMVEEEVEEQKGGGDDEKIIEGLIDDCLINKLSEYHSNQIYEEVHKYINSILDDSLSIQKNLNKINNDKINEITNLILKNKNYKFLKNDKINDNVIDNLIFNISMNLIIKSYDNSDNFITDNLNNFLNDDLENNSESVNKLFENSELKKQKLGYPPTGPPTGGGQKGGAAYKDDYTKFKKERFETDSNNKIFKNDINSYNIKKLLKTVIINFNNFGKLNFAFNNAGIFFEEAKFHEYDDNIWDEHIAVGLKGIYLCMKSQLSLMLNNQDSHSVIVNNASTVGSRGSEASGAGYTAAKHGILGLTKQAAVEYAKFNITVNSISVGPTLTDVTKKILENSLLELKDLFNESYQDYKIVHMLLVSYLIDGSHYSELKFDLNFKNLSLETQFIALPIKLVFEINKTLENYQIKITNYFDQNYIQSLFKGQNIDLSEMAYKSKSGFNNNEVSLIPKNIKKTGFFEKFFQLFS